MYSFGMAVADLARWAAHSTVDGRLSTRCRPADALQAAAEVRAYLAEHGVAVSAEQQTKTRRALEFFSRRLAAA